MSSVLTLLANEPAEVVEVTSTHGVALATASSAPIDIPLFITHSSNDAVAAAGIALVLAEQYGEELCCHCC